MAIEKELLDQLLAGRDPSEVFGKNGLLDDLKKTLSERILNAELDEHLDVERGEGSVTNHRTGHRKRRCVLPDPFPNEVRIDRVFSRKFRYRCAWLKAGCNKVILRPLIEAASSIPTNQSYREF